MNFEMVPGDIIEWTYIDSTLVVDNDEELWSSLMKKWVSVGSSIVHVLVSIDEKRMSWVNLSGTFCARVSDKCPHTVILQSWLIIPRKKI